MAYYIVALLIFYVGIGVCTSHGNTSATVLLACAIPILALPVLRGDSGTDTAAYYNMVSGFASSPAEYGGEPLFSLYAQCLWAIFREPRIVVNLLSATTAGLLFWAIARTRYGAWFGGLVLVPALYYELTFNVLRFGIASSIFLIASRIPFQQKPLRYLLLGALATGFHFSAALLFILFVGATRKGQAIWVGLAALILAGGALLMPGYMSEKSDLYTDMVAPNPTSGLLFLMLHLSLIGVVLCWREDFEIPRSGLVMCVVLACSTYALTQVSYAGLRFQLILLYLLIVVLLRQYRPAGHRVPARLGVCLLMIGLIGFSGRLRNMTDEEGHGSSPFLPYQLAPTLTQYF